MKLTEKSNEIYTYVREAGGRVSKTELCNAVGRHMRSVSANVNDLVKKQLAVCETVEVEGEKLVYVTLTEAGMNFVPSDDEE